VFSLGLAFNSIMLVLETDRKINRILAGMNQLIQPRTSSPLASILVEIIHQIDDILSQKGGNTKAKS